jgi:hypothetical protein
MVESVFNIYTDTLKMFNADIFNIPFKYDFNYLDSNNCIISNSVEYSYNSYYIMYLMYYFAGTFIAILLGYIYYNYNYNNYNNYNNYKLELSSNKIICDDDTKNNMHNEINVKPFVGLYTESIMEVVKMNDTILDKMLESKNKKTMYWVLLRVQMKNPLNMNKTKFELHGNHTGDRNATKFTTKDAFMVMKFIYYKSNDNKNNSSINIGKILINFMNYYNNFVEEKYKTNDFIVVAISQIEDNTNPKEFYMGLIANEYEKNNYHDVVFTVPRTNIRAGYVLTFPIHQVYDIFLDVFTNVIFESKYYEMDNNNFELWKGMSINDLSF